MAIQCKYCGADLPKDDARFCNKCGMLVPSHPFSPQSLSASKNNAKLPGPSSPREQQERQKRILHEQVAELSPSGSKSGHLGPEEPADKVDAHNQKPVDFENQQANQASQAAALLEEQPLEKLPETPQPELDDDPLSQAEEPPEQVSFVVPSRQPGAKGRIPRPAQMTASAVDWPAPVTHIAAKESPVSTKKRLQELNEDAVLKEANEEAAPEREAREDKVKAEDVAGLANVGVTAIEDAPTQMVNSTQAASTPVEDAPTLAGETSVEDLPTRVMPVPAKNPSRMPAQVVEKSPAHNPFLSVPPTQEAAQAKFVEDWRVRANIAAPDHGDPLPSVISQTPADAPVSPYGYPSANTSVGITQSKENAAAPVRRARRRWPIVLVFLVLLILVIGGLIAALVLSQPSGNDAIVQSQLSFSSTQLGVSLLYPNGWIKQVSTAGSSASFYANNHVGEVDIITTAGGGNVTQALQQQATKMGMSGKKTEATLNFADASWQQLQGTVQVNGASYTDTILATLHGSRLFLLVQQAPQNNYADWEQEFFAPLRASLKFL